MSENTDNPKVLSVTDHGRDAAGLQYVYPVISRRAGGVSIGINLNTNNACNWRCVYCQVANLVRGDPPPVDLIALRRELDDFVGELQDGAFMRERVPEDSRRIVDVALSGNGEPSSAEAFSDVVEVILECLRARGLLDSIAVRLITNGSRVMRAPVQAGLRSMAAHNGEVWFKLDAGSVPAIRRINGVSTSADAVIRNLRACASLCPTWVQTCAFGWHESVPLRDDMGAYLAILDAAGVQSLRGVHLYGLARPSLQPEAAELRRLEPAELEVLAEPIRALGLSVQISH